MSLASGEDNHRQQRRRGSRRRPAAADSTTTGPVRPTAKKPLPQPSGKLCDYGICCHFGTACINQHTAADIDFFKSREELRLQLREMALQVEQKKVAFKRQRMAARQPLQAITNSRSTAPNRGADRPSFSPAKSGKRTSAVEQSESSAPPTVVQPKTVTVRPTTPQRPPPPTTMMS